MGGFDTVSITTEIDVENFLLFDVTDHAKKIEIFHRMRTSESTTAEIFGR